MRLILLIIPLIFFGCFNSKQTTTIQAKQKLPPERNTKVTIKGEQFFINDEITYKGKDWKGNTIEGLLMNARLVQGIFDDENPETAVRWKYPDTDEWDADRNTEEFVEAMADWKAHGLLAFTLNLQGGSPMGYGNKDWHNSAYDEAGNLKKAYFERLEKILDRADELGMVVILGLFYFGQDQFLNDEKAIIHAVDETMDWLFESGYENILIEVNNECDLLDLYDHDILETPKVLQLIKRIQVMEKYGKRFYVGTSFKGGTVPTNAIIEQSDFILLHGNGVEDFKYIATLVESTRGNTAYTPKPILFNEDDHYDFDKPQNNFYMAVKVYASWGYFDYRRDKESFENGFQSVPVDWQINSKRKKAFFGKLKEITE